MTKDEQIKMLKEQRAVLRASNEKFRKEFIDKACRWLVEHSYYSETSDSITLTSVFSDGPLTKAFRKAMTEKKNPIFEQCLANVNPETREEVRKNMDAVANCDQSKARQYSENRILAIPADVNEDGEVFYLNSDLGTSDDENNGLSGEIEMAYCNGYGQALLDNKNPWHKVSEELPKPLTYVIVRFSNNTIVVSQRTNHFIGETTTVKVTHWMPIPEIKED